MDLLRQTEAARGTPSLENLLEIDRVLGRLKEVVQYSIIVIEFLIAPPIRVQQSESKQEEVPLTQLFNAPMREDLQVLRAMINDKQSERDPRYLYGLFNRLTRIREEIELLSDDQLAQLFQELQRDLIKAEELYDIYRTIYVNALKSRYELGEGFSLMRGLVNELTKILVSIEQSQLQRQEHDISAIV